MSTNTEPRGVGPRGRNDSSSGTRRVLSIVSATADAEGLQRARWHTERERREAAITAIREQLKQQPSPRAVRACARRWNTLITQLAETIATATSSTEPTE